MLAISFFETSFRLRSHFRYESNDSVINRNKIKLKRRFIKLMHRTSKNRNIQAQQGRCEQKPITNTRLKRKPTPAETPDTDSLSGRDWAQKTTTPNPFYKLVSQVGMYE
jgi:hypothetical protein